MRGLIYKITNQETGKLYVGKTFKSLDVRFAEHVRNGRRLEGASAIAKSLREYGTRCHTIEMLEECDVNELLNREQHWIDLLGTIYIGYNVKNEYLSDARNYWGNKDLAASNLARGQVWNKGIAVPESTRFKISSTKKKKHILGLYTSFGHKHTEQTKVRLSVVAKARPKPSAETMQKWREQSTGRVFYHNIQEQKRRSIKQGESVPAGYEKGRGTIWVSRDRTAVCIDIWAKEQYIAQGYKVGRYVE